MESIKPLVLVTGATGFLGSTCVSMLLDQGYKVRGTVRDPHNKQKIAPLKGLAHSENLELVKADLIDPNCWNAAVKGCTYVLHTASPFPAAVPKNENDVIRPALEGTKNVLNACAANKVKKVVLTSSVAAILSYGAKNKVHYTEDDWCDITTVPPYQKSKTLAEKEAWKIQEALNPENKFALTVINPTLILGPAIINTDFTSGDIVRQIMQNKLFGIPKVMFTIVDVRDVAKAHIIAMNSPATDGKRYILDSQSAFWMKDMCEVLRKEFAPYGYKIPKSELKRCTLKLAGIFDRQARSIIPMWNCPQYFSNERIKKDMGIEFIKGEESLIEMAKSLIKCGIVEDKINPKSKGKK
jgi:nucleoside-diphosphate-sugar epimerase